MFNIFHIEEAESPNPQVNCTISVYISCYEYFTGGLSSHLSAFGSREELRMFIVSFVGLELRFRGEVVVATSPWYRAVRGEREGEAADRPKLVSARPAGLPGDRRPGLPPLSGDTLERCLE
jgi:hypothetical protein